jgi:hypothetical protein
MYMTSLRASWRRVANSACTAARKFWDCSMLAGPNDLDELDKWIRIGWQRRRGATSEFGFEQDLE